MLPHKIKRHKSVESIVKEFLGPQLAVMPEDLIWIPAHPSYPDDGGFTYDEILSAVRKQKHWAFVRVPKQKSLAAIIHFYAGRNVPITDVAKMLGHELGHISGSILDDESAEEARADLYGDVARRVIELLIPERKSKKKTSRVDKAIRQVYEVDKDPEFRALHRKKSPKKVPLVLLRKKPKG